MTDNNSIHISFIEASSFEKKAYSSRTNIKRMVSGAIGFVVSGSARLTINIEGYEIVKHDIITLVQGCNLSIEELSDDFKAYFLSFSSDFVRDADLLSSMKELYGVMTLHPVITADAASSLSINLINSYCAMMYEIYSKQDLTFKSEIVKNMLEAVLFAITGLYRDIFPPVKEDEDHHKNMTRNDKVFQQFLSLVAENYTTQRVISFYADTLCITPKHLAYVVKTVSGESPSNIISQAVIMDAKSKLKSTDMSVAQIADSLNFADASFFCKYFRKHVGMSPKKYRDSVREFALY